MKDHSEQQDAVVTNDKEIDQLSPVEERKAAEEAPQIKTRRRVFIWIGALAAALWGLWRLWEYEMKKSQKSIKMEKFVHQTPISE